MPHRRDPAAPRVVYRTARVAVRLAGYQELCRQLAAAGPGTFGELDSTGARSVLRRFSEAWFAAAKRRAAGDALVRFPRRRRGLVPVRWYHGTFTVVGRRVRIPTAKGSAPLWVRRARDLPVPARAGPVDHPALRRPRPGPRRQRGSPGHDLPAQ